MKKQLLAGILVLTAALAGCSSEAPAPSQGDSTSTTTTKTAQATATPQPTVKCATLKQGPGAPAPGKAPADPNFKKLPCLHEGWQVSKKANAQGEERLAVTATITNDSGIPLNTVRLFFPALDAQGNDVGDRCQGYLSDVQVGEEKTVNLFCFRPESHHIGDPEMDVTDATNKGYK